MAGVPHNQLARPLKRYSLPLWIARGGGIVLGILFAWLLVEIALRLLFFSLPPRLQLVLQSLHKTPFSDERLVPDPIWQSDIDFLTIARPVTNYEQFGSARVRFTVTTETLWGSRAAFRTTQAQVDRRVDAIALGDSFTFCFTDESDCWVNQLGELTGRNIVNLGIVSTGSVSHLRVLETFGMPLEPPLVLWQWFGNDANEDYGLANLRGETDVISASEPPPAPKTTWWDQHSAVYVLLKLLLGSEDQFAGSLQFLDRESVTRGDVTLEFGRPYLWGAFDMSQSQNQDGWQRSQSAMREAQALVESYGGRLVILLMPTKEQVYRDMAAPVFGEDRLALLDTNYALMQSFCQDEGQTCIDLLPILQGAARQGEQLYYATDLHLNPRGNAVLASALSGWLAEHPDIFES